MGCLENKCIELQIQNQLKKTDYKFCKDIYTPQTYGNKFKEKSKRKYERKSYKPLRKKYYLRKSNRRKPYLDENRHVRKFRPERNYPNRLNCYVCGETDSQQTLME